MKQTAPREALPDRLRGIALLGIASWAALSIFALLWMKKFTQGPLEFVLGLLTGKPHGTNPSSGAGCARFRREIWISGRFHD